MKMHVHSVTAFAALGSLASANPTSSARGLTSKFPDGQIKCDKFPSSFGAVAEDWLDFGGWTGLQFVPGFSLGSSNSIETIRTGTPGQRCAPGSFCSYACPTGYQKTQWPKAQGSQGRSVGGLFCNSKGYLNLSRQGYTTLCEPNRGRVFSKNDLDQVISACGADFPGTESATLAAVAQPGQNISLTHPNEASYQQNGNPAGMDYYVNLKGVGASQACVATYGASANVGLRAPLRFRIDSADGVVYISVGLNDLRQTEPNFNLEIIGGTSGPCSYVNGQWSGGGPYGCTVAVYPGKSATMRWF